MPRRCRSGCSFPFPDRVTIPRLPVLRMKHKVLVSGAISAVLFPQCCAKTRRQRKSPDAFFAFGVPILLRQLVCLICTILRLKSMLSHFSPQNSPMRMPVCRNPVERAEWFFCRFEDLGHPVGSEASHPFRAVLFRHFQTFEWEPPGEKPSIIAY